jgi:hypothetical protein
MKKLNTNFKMKRNQIVGLLVKEGFSQSTLVVMSDKQLEMLSERILGEQIKAIPGKTAYKIDGEGDLGSLPPASKGYSVSIDPVDKKPVAQPMESEVKEGLKGGQKKLDKNHNGKIDAQDFKILKGQKKKKEVKEELKGNQKNIDKNKNGKIDGEDFEILKGKKKEVKEECCPKCGVVGCKCGEKKKLDKKKLEDIDKKEIKEWVDSLVENDYHSLTTKDEIMELIKIKLHEQPDVMEPDIDVEPDIDIDPDIDAPPSPDKDPFIDPWQNPGEGPDPRPKFEKGNGGSMPAFMEFKNILKSMNQPKGADSISESIMKKIRNVLKNGK